MSKNRGEILFKTLQIYEKVKKYLEFSYKIDIIKDHKILDVDEHLIHDISMLLFSFLDEEPEEKENKEFKKNLSKGVGNLYKAIFVLLQKLIAEPENLDIDVEIYEEDGVTTKKGFVLQKDVMFMTHTTTGKEACIKYNNKIFAVSEIVSNDDIKSTILKFKTPIFKTIHEFTERSEDPTEKYEEMDISNGAIVGYMNMAGPEYRRLLNCLAEGKSLLPEVETTETFFKDFVGLTYCKDARRVTKVNHEDSKYKVGDIIGPKGEVLK